MSNLLSSRPGGDSLPLPRHRSRIAVLAGTAGFLGLAVWGAFAPQSPANLSRAERLLAQSAEAATTRLGVKNVRIAMDGQKAVLTGTVPNPEIKAALLKAVMTSTPAPLGAGGEISGGVTRITDRVEILGANAPWHAVRQRFGALELSGPAPDARAERLVHDHAEDVFPGFARPVSAKVEARIEADSGPSGPAQAWPAAAQAGISALSHLSEAEFVLIDGRAALEGCAPDSAALEKARLAAAGTPAPFAVAFSVENEEILGEYAPTLCLRPGVAQCNEAFAAVLRGQKSRFDVNSAALPNPDPRFLQQLGAFARRCARFSVTVAGHTDNRGTPEDNLALAERRAGSMRDYLIAAGLRPERLSIAGLGAAQPKCSNDTPEGQACNRRVEIAFEAAPS